MTAIAVPKPTATAVSADAVQSEEGAFDLNWTLKYAKDNLQFQDITKSVLTDVTNYLEEMPLLSRFLPELTTGRFTSDSEEVEVNLFIEKSVKLSPTLSAQLEIQLVADEFGNAIRIQPKLVQTERLPIADGAGSEVYREVITRCKGGQLLTLERDVGAGPQVAELLKQSIGSIAYGMTEAAAQLFGEAIPWEDLRMLALRALVPQECLALFND